MKDSKKINIALLFLTGLYIGLLAYPNLLFSYSFKYKSITIHSRDPIPVDIKVIVESAEYRLMKSELYSADFQHNIYLCNSYPLYTLLAPLSRRSFACNYPILNNIFVAQSDISKNESYTENNNEKDKRQLDELIAHEMTHTFIEKGIGYWGFRTLATWKNEGYSEYIGYNREIALDEIQHFMSEYKQDKSEGVKYRRYHYAVTYSIQHRNFNFKQLVEYDKGLEHLILEIESLSE